MTYNRAETHKKIKVNFRLQLCAFRNRTYDCWDCYHRKIRKTSKQKRSRRNDGLSLVTIQRNKHKTITVTLADWCCDVWIIFCQDSAGHVSWSQELISGTHVTFWWFYLQKLNQPILWNMWISNVEMTLLRTCCSCFRRFFISYISNR